MDITCFKTDINRKSDNSQRLQGRNGCPCCDFDLFLPPTSPNESSREPAPPGDSPIGPKPAFETLIRMKAPLLVDTHGHPQLERDRDETYDVNDVKDLTCAGPELKAIICAVEPADWSATLDLASKSNRYLPALGIHPWYLGDELPEDWLSQLERLLLEHPSAIVGEIGLCKMARWTRQYDDGKAAAMEIQRQIFQQQLELAARLRRPVSVHCVNQHGILVDVIKDLLKRGERGDQRLCFPPTIAMHSFTGTAHQARELLKIEEQLLSEDTSPLFYFGFSHTVNYVMNTSEKSRRKGLETVRSIPANRLMVESDVHSTIDLMGGTVGAVSYVAWARNETIPYIASITSENGIRFLTSVIIS
jgi:Tat protein secretion system quality control protein TatD with DNase activity